MSLFANKWEMINPGPWVLEVVTWGYKIEFTATPPSRDYLKETPVPTDPEQREALETEIAELLRKQAIRQVEGLSLYRSSFFLTHKKGNLWRPILNLKPLNKRFIRPKRFRMETLASILPLLQEGMWAATIDLKDAYLHIPIHQSHRRFLAFRYRQVDYQFTALPFGLSTAPRVFTRVTRAVVAYLRRIGLNVFAYIDDWLVVSSTREDALRDVNVTLSLLEELGWVVNRKKSNLDPTQSLVYLGAKLDLATGVAFPTDERLHTLLQLAEEFMTARVAPAGTWLRLLGYMASMVDILDLCRLRMRPIQSHLLSVYRPKSDPLSKLVEVPDEMLPHLRWWTKAHNVGAGSPFQDHHPQTSISTDASLSGWGASWGDQVAHGSWSAEERQSHINALEIQAVTNAVRHWGPRLAGHRVTILSDNTPTVAYINRQGGTRSKTLLDRTWTLLTLCHDLDIRLVATHLAGSENTVADALSRGTFRTTEWSLDQTWADYLFQMFDRPQVDAFASTDNNKLPLFCTRNYHHLAWRIDAFAFPWTGLYIYAFPPWGLIRRVLLKVMEDRAEVLLLAPCWPNQPWFPLMVSLLVDCPFRLPTSKQKLLTQRRGTIWYRDLTTLHLSAWRLSGRKCRRQAFHETLSTWPSRLDAVQQCGFMTTDSRDSASGHRRKVFIPWKRHQSR